ncbi:MAG TPA: c-type cytochrome [Casimicrobiaceae bacterium]|nr:c-type cytochrome [Casimicrobiaceae bacterium]
MRTALPWLAAIALAPPIAPAHAQSDMQRARDLAASCSNCHGTAGRAQGQLPVLAGQPKADIVSKLNDFRDGKRPATIMHQLAKGYTPDQIDMIAGWFSQQKP